MKKQFVILVIGFTLFTSAAFAVVAVGDCFITDNSGSKGDPSICLI